MVWPDRTQLPTPADYVSGEGCPYCLNEGHAFGGHPYSRPGLLGAESCPVCHGRPAKASASDENNAPGGTQYGAPAIGGGGAPAAMLAGTEGLETARGRNPNRALGVGQAT
jgi:hypothetical protein